MLTSGSVGSGFILWPRRTFPGSLGCAALWMSFWYSTNTGSVQLARLTATSSEAFCASSTPASPNAKRAPTRSSRPTRLPPLVTLFGLGAVCYFGTGLRLSRGGIGVAIAVKTEHPHIVHFEGVCGQAKNARYARPFWAIFCGCCLMSVTPVAAAPVPLITMFRHASTPFALSSACRC